jgi:von Willebrand factor type A domain
VKLSSCSLLLFLASVALAQVPRSDDVPSVAKLPITIVGSSQPVPKDSISAQVDQKPAEIVQLSPSGDQLVNFAVIFDMSGSNRDKEAFLRQNSLKLFDSLEQHGYHGMFGDFNDELYLNPKTSTHDAAVSELAQVRFRGGTALYASIADSAKRLAKQFPDPSARRAIFVFTDGEDNASDRSLKTAIAETQKSGVSVYCIGVLGNDVQKKSVETLNAFASYTGGAAVLLNQPKEFIEPLLSTVKQQYWISIKTTLQDNKPHTLSITTENHSLKVFAPSEFRIEKTK